MRKSLESLAEPNTGVCIGLDPDLSKFPLELRKGTDAEQLFNFLAEVIELTKQHAASYKIQKAFFDRYEGGTKTLKRVVDHLHSSFPERPVIIDCKIGDTVNTMRMYTELLFDYIDADGVTVNPFMGDDVFRSFKRYGDRGLAVLFRTSNRNAAPVQDVMVAHGEQSLPLWKHILDYALQNWNNDGNIIPVLSGHVDLEGIREKVGDDTPILYAGIGMQGVDLQPMKHLLNSCNSGVFVNSSREILYPYTVDHPTWRSQIENAATVLMHRIRGVKNG